MTADKPADGPERDESEAVSDMMQLVYSELRALAGGYFRRQPDGHTLQPTALVHEAFVRLAASDAASWNSREHFFAVAATAMRQILASHARRRGAQKRGGGRAQITLTDVVATADSSAVDMYELERALSQLEELSPRQARIVEYRFFGGLTVEEIARVLEVSLTTVEKDWRRARAWLAAELA